LIRKESDNNVIITEEGDRIAKELGFRVQFQNQKDRFLPPYLLKDIEEAVSNFTKSIFPPNPYLFQWYFATGSIQDITEYMIKEFDVEGRNVACVMSSTVGLSLSLTGYTANGGKGVYVFDKDKDIIKELRRRGVQSIEYDVADPIPQDRVKSFNYLTKTGSK
jgi:predicted methyltransferase